MRTAYSYCIMSLPTLGLIFVSRIYTINLSKKVNHPRMSSQYEKYIHAFYNGCPNDAYIYLLISIKHMQKRTSVSLHIFVYSMLLDNTCRCHDVKTI